jgi:hypothetical protein
LVGALDWKSSWKFTALGHEGCDRWSNLSYGLEPLCFRRMCLWRSLTLLHTTEQCWHGCIMTFLRKTCNSGLLKGYLSHFVANVWCDIDIKKLLPPTYNWLKQVQSPCLGGPLMPAIARQRPLSPVNAC